MYLPIYYYGGAFEKSGAFSLSGTYNEDSSRYASKVAMEFHILGRNSPGCLTGS